MKPYIINYINVIIIYIISIYLHKEILHFRLGHIRTYSIQEVFLKNYITDSDEKILVIILSYHLDLSDEILQNKV